MSAIGFDQVIGQPAAVDSMRASLAADEVAHAWLLVGPSGVGQRDLGRALAAALNCPEAGPGAVEGCGACGVCAQIADDAAESFQVFEPNGAEYRVADVRDEWMALASRKLPSGGRRVVRIRFADRMNEAAQSAFLKVLEEPLGPMVWVLEAESDAPLLETVISRCRRLDVVPWGPAQLETRAAELGVPQEQQRVLARACLGLPERLEELADPDMTEARWGHLSLLDRLATGGPGQVVPLASEQLAWAKSRVEPVKEANARELERAESAFGVESGRGWPAGIKQQLDRRFKRRETEAQRHALTVLLDHLASYLRDLLAVQAGAGQDLLVNVDHLEALRRDAQRLPARHAVEGLQAIADCREALAANGNPQLQLERMLYQLALPMYAAA